MPALLVGPAACGGESGPTPEEFAQETNAICGPHTETIEAAASEVLAGGQLPNPEEFGRLAQETIIPELTQQFEELRAVEPPEDISADFDEYLAEGEQTLESIQQDPSVITNPANFRSLNQQADELGVSDACSVGPG